MNDLQEFKSLPSKFTYCALTQHVEFFVSICRQPESMIAPYLTSLQERLRPNGIQVGSYPVLYKGVFVSLIGRDPDSSQGSTLRLAEVAHEVEREVGGRICSEEEVAAQKKETASNEVDALNVRVKL